MKREVLCGRVPWVCEVGTQPPGEVSPPQKCQTLKAAQESGCPIAIKVVIQVNGTWWVKSFGFYKFHLLFVRGKRCVLYIYSFEVHSQQNYWPSKTWMLSLMDWLTSMCKVVALWCAYSHSTSYHQVLENVFWLVWKSLWCRARDSLCEGSSSRLSGSCWSWASGSRCPCLSRWHPDIFQRQPFRGSFRWLWSSYLPESVYIAVK